MGTNSITSYEILEATAAIPLLPLSRARITFYKGIAFDFNTINECKKIAVFDNYYKALSCFKNYSTRILPITEEQINNINKDTKCIITEYALYQVGYNQQDKNSVFYDFENCKELAITQFPKNLKHHFRDEIAKDLKNNIWQGHLV